MKTLIIIALFATLTLNGFSQEANVKDLLNNEATRTEIFNAIAMNPELKKEFMATMKMHQGHMSMQKGNEKMMESKGQMGMKGETPNASMMNSPEKREQMMTKMMEMCKSNPDMQKMMADKMTKSPEMMQTMMKMMKEKGMMDKKGCMKKDKGMMKKGMQPKSSGNTEEHKH